VYAQYLLHGLDSSHLLLLSTTRHTYLVKRERAKTERQDRPQQHICGATKMIYPTHLYAPHTPISHTPISDTCTWHTCLMAHMYFGMPIHLPLNLSIGTSAVKVSKSQDASSQDASLQGQQEPRRIVRHATSLVSSL